MATFASSLKPLLIYIFAISDEYHKYCLKIGKTTLDEDISVQLQPNDPILQKAAHKRIDEYTKTAGVAYNLLWTEMAVYIDSGTIYTFDDNQVHSVLERSGIKKKVFDQVKGADEWFCCDLETAKRAIAAIKQGRQSLNSNEVTHGQTPIIFRPEQHEAIRKTVMQFKKGNQMLWNAKMRFGKTLSALQVVKEERFQRTLILTHRPVVDEGWFEDFRKIFYDSPCYHYGSRTKGESFGSLQKLAKKGDSYVYFVSMQDMRGSDEVGGKFAKDSDIYSTQWDMLIIDEAHEGTTTDLGASVIKKLKKPATKVLQLSGTPFNLIDNYKESEIFTWDYIMEQRAKKEWDIIHMGDPNPYAGLPAINIYTYDLGALMDSFTDDEKAFNFREFFRTREDGSFIYETDIDNFLNLLCKDDKNSLYPYSNDHFRRIFRHTLWMVPGIKAARALSKKLQAHPVFGNFQIVNVAGNGDEDEENADALKLVNDAIGPDPGQTWTITLSCGKLTTGVSIKPWTAVFIMAGSYSTSAASYMQTIFRVQTPFIYNGKMKTECYAFDFAPDRTLRIFAEAAHVSAKVGKQTDEDRKVLGEFLNFCPIISIVGSQMMKYDAAKMMGELKRAQIDRVVRDGFGNDALYSDELLRLKDVDLEDFSRLKGIIGNIKALGKTADIDVNSQGLTNEEYEEKERLQRKPKKQLTEEEQRRLEELKNKKTQRREAISILRGISIRMPLLIYGSELKNEEDEITIDNFADRVDDKSWEEFMPAGVTKAIFANFKRYYDADVFSEAGKRIREMARAADKFTIEERIERIATIFNTFRNPDKETVFTPWRVVNMHLGDCLGGYNFYDKDYKEMLDTPRFIEQHNITKDVFAPDEKILEINSKSGLYPLYCAYSIYRSRLDDMKQKYGEVGHAFAQSLWDATIEQNIFVVCKTPMAVSITKRTLTGFRDVKVNAQYYPNLVNRISQNQATVVNVLRDGKNFWHFNKDTDMKFKAVVGNPPYQKEGENTRKQPVYNYFYDLAFDLAPKATLITPGRFLFRAGQTPGDWVDKFLADPHIKVVDYFQKSADVFPTVDIKGGVAICYRDTSMNFGPIGFFSIYPELSSITQKVTKNRRFSFISFADLVSPQGIYRFTDNAFKDYPQIMEIQGVGTASKITSKTMNSLPALFHASKESDNDICMLGLSGGKRVYRWIDKKYVYEDTYLYKYKVFVPEANGSGAIGEVLSTPIIGTPIIGTPIIGTTDTFLNVGPFDTEFQATSCLKYVKTKFCRTLLGTLKATQHNPRSTWANVPLQDFTSSSDIDWSESVADIDRQLYKKYGLDTLETDFIERTIKPME